MVQITEKKVLSSDGTHELYGKVYVPDGELRGLFHVVHGMCEHIARYHEFLLELAENGYVAFAYDQLGHGHTAADESELGFFAHENGWKRLVDDVALFGNEVKQEYGSELPYCLLGFSMGSFIVRLAAEQYDIQDKLIIMSTGGPHAAADPGLAAIGAIKKLKGEKYISNFILNLAFRAYNKRFDENDTYSWLTTNEEIRKKFVSDPLCSYRFTISAMCDLVRLSKECNTGRWFGSRVTKKPILLLSGSDDPVGNYGKGVKTVYDKLKANGADVKFKLYAGCRHEILNDKCRKKVIKDILEFTA